MKIEYVTEHLYVRLPNAVRPQECYIEIVGDILRARASGEVDEYSMTQAAYNGVVQRVSISPDLSARQINELLDDVAPLAERVADGIAYTYTEGVDKMATPNADARDALREMERLAGEMADRGELRVYTPREWLMEQDGLDEVPLLMQVDAFGGPARAAKQWVAGLSTSSTDIVEGIETAEDLVPYIERYVERHHVEA